MLIEFRKQLNPQQCCFLLQMSCCCSKVFFVLAVFFALEEVIAIVSKVMLLFQETLAMFPMEKVLSTPSFFLGLNQMVKVSQNSSNCSSTCSWILSQTIHEYHRVFMDFCPVYSLPASCVDGERKSEQYLCICMIYVLMNIIFLNSKIQCEIFEFKKK